MDYSKGFIAVVSLWILLLVLGVIVLFCQYHFICAQSQKIVAIQKRYRVCMQVAKNVLVTRYIRKKKNHAVIQMTEGVKKKNDSKKKLHSDLFVLVNRKPEYLKASAFSYFKKYRLDELLSRIDQYEWDDYTGSISSNSVLNNANVCYNERSKFSSKKKLQRSYFFRQPLIIWPIDHQNFWISSLFGPRRKANGEWGFHYGIDMAARKGTLVKAIAEGIVEEASYIRGYGNTVLIRHTKHNVRFKTRYAHLQNISVLVYQAVIQGDIIGTVGATGLIRKIGKDGSHLHFELYKYGKRVNPLYYLPKTCRMKQDLG